MTVDRIRSLKSTEMSELKMMASLEGLGKILDNLVIRSPIEGLLTMPYWEVGQAVQQGQRLGNVDVVGVYKVRVPIDELYKPRITTGLHASTDLAGKTYGLVITYVYTTVTAGRFDVDMEFEGDVPPGLSRGQSLRLRIELRLKLRL